MAKKKSRTQRTKAQARKAANTPVAAGQQAFHRGDFDAAIVAWEQALRQQPSPAVTAALAEVRFRRGLARLQDPAQASAAVADLDAAVHLMPGDPRYHYHLGRAHHLLGNLAAALPAYAATLELDPTFLRAAELAVLIALEKGEKPRKTAAWNLLAPQQQSEFELLSAILAGRPLPSATHASQDRARLWRALGALLSDDPRPLPELLSIAQDQSEPPAVRALSAYALGLGALHRDRLAEALGHWQAAQRLGLATPTLHRNLVRLYYYQAENAAHAGQWAEAAALVDAAAKLAPDDPHVPALARAAHWHAGYADAQAGRWKPALVHWEQAREQGDNSRQLLQNLALAYENLERYDEAAELWRQVIRRRPRKTTARDALSPGEVALLWDHVAECYRRSGDVDEAIRTLRNAIKNDPHNSDLRLRLVDALIAQERWEAAGNETDRILALAPAHVGALVRSARIQEQGWFPGNAIRLWHQVLQLEPDHLEARERLAELTERQGDALLQMGSADQALKRFREALSYLPQEPHLYLSCADCYFVKDDHSSARQQLEHAFSLRPDDLSLFHTAVDLCHLQNRPDEAEWVITRAAALAAPHQPNGRLPAGFFLELAECARRRQQDDVADDYADRAEEAAAGDPDGLVQIALFYEDCGDDQRTAHFFNLALRLDPEHGPANLHLGIRYAYAVDMPAANRHWRQARRTARRTGDTELLALVQATRRYFKRAIEMMEQGLPPPPPIDHLDHYPFDLDDDADWNE
jgi:tetratricopeptide (TPR) repeat protein